MMKRTNQILSTVFLMLLLFLNIGLTLSLKTGLHAHILGDNKILVHFHHTQGGTHSHNSNDCNSSSGFAFSTTLTYLNNAENIALKSASKTIGSNSTILSQNSYTSRPHHHSQWRGPPTF